MQGYIIEFSFVEMLSARWRVRAATSPRALAPKRRDKTFETLGM
jgi:hypothetical protein